MTPAEFAQFQVFLEVAERQSFARAAAHLGVTRSSVSQSVKQLELRLNTRLLNRTTRSVAPTAAGERLMHELQPALRTLRQAAASVLESQERAAGSLRLTVSRVAADLFLGPRLAAFNREYPHITLEISVEDKMIDIIKHRFDAGIRRGELIERDMIARRLTPDARYLAVASPEYIAANGVPAKPQDLRHHACIQIRRRLKETLPTWQFRDQGVDLEVRVGGKLVVDDARLALRAALDGGGIVRLAEDYVRDELASGRLEPLLARHSPLRPGLFLYYPGRKGGAALQALCDFLTRAKR